MPVQYNELNVVREALLYLYKDVIAKKCMGVTCHITMNRIAKAEYGHYNWPTIIQ